jgi:hypothetical protein
MFVADWDGRIYKYTSGGTLEQSVPTGAFNLLDIDLHPDGTLIVGGRFGDVVLSDISLQSMQPLSVGSGLTYVAFAASIPEPSTYVLAALGLASLSFVARKRNRRLTPREPAS